MVQQNNSIESLQCVYQCAYVSLHVYTYSCVLQRWSRMIIQKLKMLIARSGQLGFRNIVAHQWTGSYLLKNTGAHYRKALQLFSKKIARTLSDWTGTSVWLSPIVALAPPTYSVKKRNDAVISVSIGAREAMISFRQINENEKWNRRLNKQQKPCLKAQA